MSIQFDYSGSLNSILRTYTLNHIYLWTLTQQKVEEISATHEEDGGFESAGKGLFSEVAKVYNSVAYDTILGEEKTERRKRGLTIEDVATAMGEGNGAKRKKSA